MSVEVVNVKTCEDLAGAIEKWLTIAPPFERAKFTSFVLGYAEAIATNNEREEDNDNRLGE